jgi:hypothetical protein
MEMAYHEQHEQKCPFCGEYMSATAPKCLNCGRYVDEEDDEEQEGSGPPTLGRGYLIGLVVVLIGIGVAIYFYRSRQVEEQRAAQAAEVEARQLHQMLAEKAGRGRLNASSPVTLAEVKPHLRAGMPFQELGEVVSRKNAGPKGSTVIGTVPLAGEGDRPRQAHILYLRDANLTVETDADDNVVSWREEAIE